MTEALPAEPIAIIGIGCRYPGAGHPAAFWQMLRSGLDGVTEVPASRWENGLDPKLAHLRRGGFLEQIDQFDPQFFGIAPCEAITMDPQQRLLLEVAWEALEDAGQRSDRLRGSKTGVFVGISTHDYSVMLWQQPVDNPYATTGTGNCIAANRISYAFDFKGPSLAIDTACSSSLVAVHLACQSLYTGESSLAIAAGVNILLVPNITAGFAQGGFMSSSGRCRSFAAAADGYVRSEGAGAVVLKPLAQALADRDPIYTIIRGSAVNQDGFGHGIAAPNPKAQTAVLRAAYQQAGVNPAEVQYVEAHGTGTKLGDPVEAQALGEVFSAGRAADDPCAIGSVKSNIGHTEAAAGIAGLIKAALVLKHRELPPSLHCHPLNPNIDFAGLRLQVQTRLAPLAARSHPAYVGVNSFGFGGTNAHVVLEEAPVRPVESSSPNQTQLLTLSAKSQPALKALAQRYQTFLAANPELPLADICTTANTRRSHFSHRLACVADSAGQLRGQLRDWAAGSTPVGTLAGSIQAERQLVWLFTGQGAQFVGMGRELYEQQPIFRQALNRCQTILAAHLQPALTAVLFADDASLLDQTAYTQPALFALEYALAQLWLAWGLRPTRLLGHSVGEYVAACLAGVFSLEAGLALIAARGRLMQALPPDGAMLSIRASQAQLQPMLSPYESEIAIAALNGTESTVISGRETAIAELQSHLESQSIQHQRLNVSHAFHSPLMAPMLAEFRQIAQGVTYSPPTLPIVSTLTGAMATADIATADYWVRHVCEPVRFLDAMTALGEANLTFLEIGPKPILLGLGRTCLANRGHQWLPSLQPERSGRRVTLQSLAALYVQGFPVDWDAVSEPAIPISLPTYPFQRQRYWWPGAEVSKLAPANPKQPTDSGHPLLGQPLPLAGTTEQRFQVSLNTSRLAYLADHQILSQALLPAAAFFEIAIACGMASLTAAGQQAQQGSFTLSATSIEQPLLLSDRETVLQTVWSPQVDGTVQIQIFSQSDQAAEFTRHAVGRLSDLTAAAPQVSLTDFQSAFPHPPADPVAYYQSLAEQGFNYGPSFQAIQQLWPGDRRALSQIQLPADLTSDGYHLHPALLDACLQSIGAALDTSAAQHTYLPVGLESLQFYRTISGSGWCGVSLHPSQTADLESSSTLKADITIWDAAGAIATQIIGMTLQSVSPASLRRLLGQTESTQAFYHLAWQAQPLPTVAQGLQPRTWLVFADTSVSPKLVASLQARGDRCIRVEPGQEFAIAAPDHYILNPACPENFQQLLTELAASLEALGKTTCDILHLWSLDTPADGQPDSQLRSCGSLLHLVQAMLKQSALKARLWLITQAAQAVERSVPVQLQQAPLWGLARSLRQEQPQLKCTCIDLDRAASPESREALLNELYAGSDETQIAYRRRDRYVARLSSQTADFLPLPETAAYRLGMARYGNLDQLTLLPSQWRAPQSNEVQIQVRAAGINFRDVLNALGLLKPVLEEMGFTDATQVPFGGECAGVITAVGSGVTGLQVGDSVIAAQALGSLAQFVTVPAAFVVPKPSGLTDAEAATLPTTFLTAYYGLIHLAQLQKGDRVLIHAAAGGVGQAAVQIAQQCGAEIFATASPGKWDFLHGLGIQQVMNSRTFDFADDILAATDGQGVDVVFNSLNGEAIPQNLRALAANGKFVEIGKIGIWQAEQIHEHRPDVEYFPFDLLEVSQAQPDLISALLSQLLAQFQAGSLRPLPKAVFPIEAAPQAFRYMAQARHIGKVVLTLPPVAPQQSLIRAGATYAVTGGFGALGQLVARWLVAQGAKHLVLIGRTMKPAVQPFLQQMEQSDVTVRTVAADVADLTALEAALSEATLPYPLKGVFHLAGCLDDGLLTNQTWARFAPVLAPKLTGAWNLHQLTRSRDLDHFVCFSSIASLLGSPGQGNYAAANAFLDALAHHRRSLGLPGLSLNWGPWAVGMAARLTEQFIAQGLNPIEPERGLQMLSDLMRQPGVQVGVMDIDWARFFPQLAAMDPVLTNLKSAQEQDKIQHRLNGANSGRKTDFESQQNGYEQPVQAISEHGQDGQNGKNGQHEQNEKYRENRQTPALLRQRLATASAEHRAALLAADIQTLLSRVMGFSSPDLIDPAESFGDLGMDSLMAVELSSQLQTQLDYPISQALIFDHPTVDALAAYLSEQLTPELADESLQTSEPLLQSASQSLAETIAHEPTSGHGANLQDSLRDSTTADCSQPVIPPEYYQFQLMPEYRRLRDQIEQASARNPFFTVYEGIASNIIQRQGRSLINYANYNYLGLSGDPRVSAAAQAAIDQYGTSVSASRIVSGERALHRELEQALAHFLGTEDCLLFVGGHATNVTTIGHLFQEKDLILYDALSHNSIREGCQLSEATAIAFPHNDWQALDRLLHQHRRHYQKVLVAVEGIYSADGDLPPLPEIVRVKTTHRAFLLVDEAHSLGVLGSHGRGVGEHFNLPASAVDLWMGTLSKSLASCGGYIAGSAALIEYLKYTAPGFVFSVGMSPANTAAALAALRLLEAEPERVAELQARSRLFLQLAQESGLNTGASQDSPIIPIIVGPTEKAVQLSQTLFQRDINAQPMVYPSVSQHAARVRFFITALHMPEQIRETVETLAAELAAFT
ncbi:aminotransferase class I/II-fold pyridoxal phosphate-dependent enzyme [Romeria aff. gracilis LEGE 07310]|uniref:Aminotransferase class I/II-fold pyridoxal phosphate-dependent enzyme n=1 Tax=Vasconcelosia minhoensis LEGE 07310 TaxID=915328 RepID=A0A8J7APA4_9CYAN|nr:type I polyketide synthase [Romeria gracilis]MBE9077761.1 aminotransferase class I/II-fold pyridoxal phosphate-dependent enzyme [Romeria aff. gracilis LEGE 07310]